MNYEREVTIPNLLLLFYLMQYIGGGFAGLQGIIYAGTNCFHRRKVIYGLSPNHDIQNRKKGLCFTNGTYYKIHYICPWFQNLLKWEQLLRQNILRDAVELTPIN